VAAAEGVQRAHAVVTSTRDAALGGQGAGIFCFQNLRTPAIEKADPFNPCCVAGGGLWREAGGQAAPLEDLRATRAYAPKATAPPKATAGADIAADDELSLNGRLCGLPIKMDKGNVMFDMDDIEMEPLAPRPPPHFPLYTGSEDLSETGGTGGGGGGATAWASVETSMDTGGDTGGYY